MSKKINNARDVFLYLLMIIALYSSVVGILTLLFQYISVLFPDTLTFSYEAIWSRIRTASATVIIMWPVYIAMSYIITKDLKNEPEKKDLGVRKWLIYLTLFISAVTIIIDLVTLVNTFLDGELTIHFFLKVLAVLIVAGGVLGYYFWEIKRTVKNKTSIPMWSGILSSIIVIGLISSSFLIVGSPKTQREYRIDQSKVDDLQYIQSTIFNYFSIHSTTPEELTDLESDVTGFSVPVPPENDHMYVYEKLSDREFKLCTNFYHPSRENIDKRYMNTYPYMSYASNWEHDSGDVCFTRTIDENVLKQVR